MGLVSPGFRLRPSLSVDPRLAAGRRPPRIAGVQTPAFVERRARRPAPPGRASGVAGVQTPAFVERCRTIPPAGSGSPVSPGFRLRPSLSVRAAGLRRRGADRRVAGVQTPAFVERPSRGLGSGGPGRVSPGFRLRPSLSGGARGGVRRGPPLVSPGFRLRPSLSGLVPAVSTVHGPGVAGVQTPAFVERTRPCASLRGRARVSPGFRLRPSLSDA